MLTRRMTSWRKSCKFYLSAVHSQSRQQQQEQEHSVLLKNTSCKCECKNNYVTVAKNVKTNTFQPSLPGNVVRFIHDDTTDRDKSALVQEQVDISDDLVEDEPVESDNKQDQEQKSEVIPESLEGTGKKPKLKTPKTKDIPKSEKSTTKKKKDTLPVEKGAAESVTDKCTDGNVKLADMKKSLTRTGSSVLDIEQFLTEANMAYQSGNTGFHTLCPKFGKMALKRNTKKREERLYVNSTSGYFYCQHCKARGSWSQLKDNLHDLISKKATKRIECFKDIPNIEKDTDDVPPQVERLLDNVQEFSEATKETFDTILSMFEWHGIKRNTFVDHGVKYKVDGNDYTVIFPTYSPSIDKITSVSVYSGKLTEEGDYTTEPVDRQPRGIVTDLFGWLNESKLDSRTRSTLIITTSEVDAMAVTQATGILALSLKNVAQLPQEILPHIEDFTKIILWLGTDLNSWDNAKIFSKKLGAKRCYVFRPTVLKYMPLEVLQIDEHIEDILALPKLMAHNSIITFLDVYQEVFSEFAHIKHVSGVQWKRYTKLNTLLKGHRRGELTIVSGPTGSGKTTFMSDYSLDLCSQGVSTLWGSFEISNVRLIKTMMQQFAGKNISKHIDEFDDISEKFSNLPLYFMMYYGQEKVENVIEAMSHAVYIHDIAHIVVDNLQFMMGMDFTEKNRFFRQDQIVSLFRNFASEKNCHVTLIIHPKKVNNGDELSTSSIFGSAKATQEADNILLLQDQRTSKSTRKYVQIAKNRFDGDLGVMTLGFNKESLSFTTIDNKKPGKETEKEISDNEETDDETTMEEL